MWYLALALACSDGPADKTGTDSGTSGDDTGTPGDDTGTDDVVVTTTGCDTRHEAFIAALQADLDASDAPGVSAALLEDGAVTCRVTLGTKSAETDTPPGIDTLFQIGSTTKMFTSLALLQKVEDGVLSLDDTLADAYPDSEFALNDAWNDEILLRHLISHQAGLYDYTDTTRSSRDEDLASFHEEIYFPYLWLMSEPGDLWNYSNSNFAVAGLVGEHHDTRFYPDIMIEDVFSPLGMTRTMQRNADVVADGNYALGVGYYMTSPSTADYGPVAMEDVPDPGHGRPAGVSTWSTPDQVLQMARFLMEGDTALLSDELRLAMTTPQASVGYGEAYGDYGYGVFVAPGAYGPDGAWYAMDVWEHGGNTNSYSSAFAMLPDYDFAVSVLSSGYGTDFSTSVATAATTLLDLPDPSDPPELEWDPDRLDLHVGTYSDPYNVGDLIVTRRGDSLFVEMPQLESYGYDVNPELYAVSSDLWYLELDGAWYDLLFVGGDGETPSQYARNRYFVCSRDGGDTSRFAPTAPPDPGARLRAGRIPAVPFTVPRPPPTPRASSGRQ